MLIASYIDMSTESLTNVRPDAHVGIGIVTCWIRMDVHSEDHPVTFDVDGTFKFAAI